MADTNVGLGMVPCKKHCHCHDCTVDRLQLRVTELERELRYAVAQNAGGVFLSGDDLKRCRETLR